jgi:hypothetical protein
MTILPARADRGLALFAQHSLDDRLNATLRELIAARDTNGKRRAWRRMLAALRSRPLDEALSLDALRLNRARR